MATEGNKQNEDFVTQFAVMLRPIKELDENWAVDLANYLQTYLEKYVHQNPSADLRGLNFSQAAMLIQGSAHIYSRKVQFLYNLTLELYEQLISQKKSKQSNESNVSDDSNSDEPGNVTEQFLSLDDLNVNNINRNSNRRSTLTSFRTPVPSFLKMVQDDFEKDNYMLLNIKGSQLGKRNDASLNRFLMASDDVLLAYGREEHILPAEIHSPAHHEDYNEAGDVSAFHDGCASPPPPDAPLDPPRSTEKRTRHSILATAVTPRKPVLGSWSQYMLNPHQDTKGNDKPVKQMKVHRLPKRLRKKNQNMADGEENEENVFTDLDIPPLGVELIHKTVFSNVSKFPKNSLKIPSSDVFYHKFWEQHKKTRELLKEINKKRRNLNINEVDDEDQENERFVDDGMEHDLGPDDEPESLVSLEGVPINQHQSGNDQFDALVMDTHDVPVVTTYEELARELISHFEKSDKFRCNTDISKRVEEWDDMIRPLLEEEETHRLFDIHAYGSEILDCFENNNRKQTLPFRRVVKGKDTFEIPRYFLSSLMLANNYNVELTTKGVMEEGMDTLELTLLSRKQHHEEFLEFQTNT